MELKVQQNQAIDFYVYSSYVTDLKLGKKTICYSWYIPLCLLRVNYRKIRKFLRYSDTSRKGLREEIELHRLLYLRGTD